MLTETIFAPINPPTATSIASRSSPRLIERIGVNGEERASGFSRDRLIDGERLRASHGLLLLKLGRTPSFNFQPPLARAVKPRFRLEFIVPGIVAVRCRWVQS